MKEEKGGLKFLRWPWNVVIYILLAAALRIFAIPVILLLMWYQNKRNPHGAAEGYCLSRARKRLSWLLWAVLLLVIGVCLGSLFFVGLGLEMSGIMDYVTLAVAAVGGVGLTLGGFYMGYIAVRDTFFPAKSGLANSIRLQLPYPEEAPPVEELFAMVDKDLKEHGQWFGAVGIGQEWVLGDLANRIDRIRGIFTVDEIHRHHTKTGTRSNRVLQLVLIDDRWQRNATDFSNPGDLRAAAECLALRVPEAVRGVNGQYREFWNMDESGQEEFEREFRQKKALRESEAVQRASAAGGPQDMIFQSGGERTSRVTMELVKEHLRRCLEEGSGAFTLIPTRPIETAGRVFRALYVSVEDGTVWLAAELAGQAGLSLAKPLDRRQAEEVIQGWLRREAPNTADWEMRRVYDASAQAGQSQPQRQAPPNELALLLASGAAERHTTFTREDVQVAAEGIVDGTYQKVRLSITKKFLWMEIEAGDKSDARCTVRATRPDPDKLRFFISKTTPRQAAAWLTEYFDERFLPGGSEWKDYTKQVEKRK